MIIAPTKGQTEEEFRAEVARISMAHQSPRVLKHGDHDQSTHAPKGSASGSAEPVYWSSEFMDAPQPEIHAVYTSMMSKELKGEQRWTSPAGADDREIREVHDYIMDSESTNVSLRLGNDDESPHMDTLIRKVAPFPRDITLYRGMRAAHAEGKNVGDTIQDKGWQSTTFSPRTATHFGQAGNSGIVLAIKAPKGTRAIPGSRGEQEFILNRGTSLKILSKKPFFFGPFKPGKTYIPPYEREIWEVEIVNSG